MRRILSSCVFGALGMALFLSCTEDDGLASLGEEGALLELSVRVEEPSTKGMIHTDYLPAGSELGLTVTDMSGGNYNGHNYQNIKYSAKDHNGVIKWQGSDPVKMTDVPGKLVAYYPYRESVTDPKSIQVDVNEQTDWLFSGSMEGFDKTNVKAEMQLQHAQAAVQVSVRRGTYIGTGALTSVSWSGDCVGSSAKLDASTGQFKSISKTAITQVVTHTLSPAAEAFETFVIPTGVTGNLNLELVVDGTTYQASIPSVSLVSSQVYQCKLVVNASILEVEKAEVVPWTVLNKGAVSYKKVDWKSLPSGIYYVGKDGCYQAQPSLDCMGVALIETSRDIRIMIEKKEYSNASYKQAYINAGISYSSTYTDFYWGSCAEDGPMKSYKYVLGSSETMYIPSVAQFPVFDSDYALADTCGWSNSQYLKTVTVAIGAGMETNSKYPTAGVLLNTFLASSGSYGYKDWHIPSLGEFALIMLRYEDVNDALLSIGGVKLSSQSNYWTSTEQCDLYAYCIYFTSQAGTGPRSKGLVGCQIRFVRDLWSD